MFIFYLYKYIVLNQIIYCKFFGVKYFKKILKNIGYSILIYINTNNFTELFRYLFTYLKKNAVKIIKTLHIWQ